MPRPAGPGAGVGACGRSAVRPGRRRELAPLTSTSSAAPRSPGRAGPGPERRGGRPGLPGPRPADVPRGDRRLGRGPLLPGPDRRRRALLQVPPRVPAGPDRAVPPQGRGRSPPTGSGTGRSPPSGRPGRRTASRTTRPRGRRGPPALGPTPPGVVLSAPDSPMLAGAVALAAGRFQPLVRWDVAKRFADILSADEAQDAGRVARDEGRRHASRTTTGWATTATS